jgi:hypothetical protein
MTKACFIFFIFLNSKVFAFDRFLNSAKYNSMVGAGIASTSRIGMEDMGLINPAVLSTKADLAFNGGYFRGESSEQDVSGFSVSVLDSSNGAWDSQQSRILEPSSGFPLASVFYYSNFEFDNSAGHFKDQYFQLSVAQPLMHNLSVGLIANYSIMQSNLFSGRENAFDLGAGLLWRFRKAWSVGLTALHLLEDRKEVAPGYLNRTLGVGLEYVPLDSVHIRFDILRSKALDESTESVLRLGVTNTISENLMLQFGVADDRILDTKIFGLGFIVVGPRLTLAYAFKRETSYNSQMHSVDIRVPVW